MKVFNWNNIRLLLMFILVVFLFSFTSKRNSKRKLTKTEVVFVGENALFLKRETVNKLLIENNSNAVTIRKDRLDLNKLEQVLNTQKMIAKADVCVSIDGVLKAVVKQKTPIARVFNDEGSFYIDSEGDTMPLSENFTARVPLVSGEINKKNSEDLFKLFKIIYDDVFLRKNIIGIQIMPNGSLLMQNRNYNYRIDFGGLVNMERKFQNYKAFFQKVSLDGSLDKYKIIDLRFTEQVVCTK
ncbi:cell division protein FtsQ/DivIB [Flavobacterium gilvum]|uniref:Cell division protein FtsQ n=1 Tax=Flavobacterium gilvum TaxID=1492737 RepID=A0AAC9I2Y0_9FLAO|nr:cell division protein FtsQ [Flavobacterium gilvum]AOW09289.1 cell division protein FtsQ [Flavobacterium gilvum]KFC59531.1 cell division protein FtsQ [Flavobacterium gilvum]